MDRNDLISRSELKKAFNWWWGCDDIPSSVVKDLIDDAPTVEYTFEEAYQTGYEEGYEKAKKELKRPQDEWYITPDRQITIEEYMQSLKGEN